MKGAKPLTADGIDRQLHSERVSPDRSKRTFVANLEDLPNGVMVQRQGEKGRVYLLWDDRLLLWSPGGYREKQRRTQQEEFLVLTPRSTVAAIRAGYCPAIHPSVSRT